MKYFDFLGESPSLYFNNDGKIKTKFGSIMSLIILLLLIALFWGLGQDFFKRSNPNMSYETVNPLNSYKLMLNEDNFEVAFRFEDFDMNHIENNILYMTLEFYEASRLDSGKWNRTNSKKMQMERCISNVNSKNEQSFLDKQLPNAGEKGWLCPNFRNITVGGSYDANSDYIGYFMVKTYICRPGHKNFNNEDCNTTEIDIKALFKSRIFFSTMIQSMVVTPSDYANGINKILSYTTYDLDKNFYKDIILKFSENILENDYGWIIQSKSVSKIIGLSKENTNILSFDSIKEEDLVLSSTFFFIKDHSKYIRTYKKIQEVVADVGGMIEIFLIIFGFIVGVHNNYYYMLKLSPLITLNKNENQIITTIKNPDNELNDEVLKKEILNIQMVDSKDSSTGNIYFIF